MFRRAAWLIPLILVAAGPIFLLHTAGITNAPADAKSFYTVVPLDMPITLVKSGELQAVHNIEIKCEVDGQPAIQTLIEEGSSVKKGDLLMTLDSSAISQRIEETSLNLERVEADLTTAREMQRIQESQNEADLEVAQDSLTLARFALRRYEEGTYPQQGQNAQSEFELARIGLASAEEALVHSRALFEQQFVTATAVKNDELTVTTARNRLERAQTSLKVLSDYAHLKDQAARLSDLSQAEQRLARTRRINANRLAQCVGDVRARERTLSILRKRMDRLQRQFEACTVKAPSDGLVIYGTSGDWSARVALQVGNTVRREQLLFRLPQTSAMKAIVRIEESQLAQLRNGMSARVKVVGVPEAIDASLTRMDILPDTTQRSFNPDLREYAIELTLTHSLPQLMPGMGLIAEIYTDEMIDVPVVPLAAIHSAGQESFVFVKNGDKLEPRKVTIGRTTDRFAELLDNGVQSGEQLLNLDLNQGSELLARAKISPAQPKPDLAPAPAQPSRSLAKARPTANRPPNTSG